ncbi:MAG: histidine phosphatase family protein [Candidatus Komeilibacteria bacterium]|nr:histidine phosphatase family protein [Candidatus Komeilibacteria bacterium]
MNKVIKRNKLNNRYYVMRHGNSQANVARLIASWPTHSINKFGLTKKGQQEVLRSLKRAGFLNQQTIIYSSDFLRTRQTSEIARRYLKIKKVFITPLLRERNFGQLEFKSSKHYAKAWAYDRKNPRLRPYGSESVLDVQKRLLKLIGDLEKRYQGQTILLVSHGDPLKILIAAFKGVSNPFADGHHSMMTGRIKMLEFKK